MGWYIEVPKPTGKREQLIQLYGAVSVTYEEAKAALMNSAQAVIVIMHNPFFEAAGFAYNGQEFDAFTRPHDTRKKDFLLMEREQVRKLTGYDKTGNP